MDAAFLTAAVATGAFFAAALLPFVFVLTLTLFTLQSLQLSMNTPPPPTMAPYVFRNVTLPSPNHAAGWRVLMLDDLRANHPDGTYVGSSLLGGRWFGGSFQSGIIDFRNVPVNLVQFNTEVRADPKP